VKIRGGGPLEVKAYRGSPGTGLDDSRSYAEWLCQQPGVDSDAGP
jgi:hypothetical protein